MVALSKEEAKEKIASLITEFESKKDYYWETDEANIETKLIEPLFEALGWTKKDFEKREKLTSKAGRRQIPDYTFKLNEKPVFFLEAKKVSVDIETDQNTWRQAISYALSKRAPFAILTNFRSIRVFCVEQENAAQNIFRYFKFNDFVERFNELWLLSKESFEKNEMLHAAESEQRLKKRITIDKPLLEDFITSRRKIVASLEKNYPTKYTTEEKEDIAQRLLGRLIFIRKAEDIGINVDNEGKDIALLEEITELPDNEAFPKLKKIFQKYEEVFDSELFMQTYDKDLEHAGIEGKIVKELVKHLYYSRNGELVYNFDWITSDVLGNVYEQYLGNIIRETAKGAKAEESRPHRKEQGIYYTPTYIVDYIVRNTLEELIKDKKPSEVDKIKVLDPACGSGSFLIKAFDVLNEYYVKNDKNYAQTHFDSTSGGLSYKRKIDILKNNIFGVDLDKKAVEISQLNMLLKIAEKGHRLPLLHENIKCGNSLIDDAAIASNKAFKWEEQFNEIMDEGGFDVVIGNPPYFNIRTNLELQDFCRKRYPEIYHGQNDVLYYFILKGLSVLKEKGYLSFIVSRYFLESDSAKKFRDFILKNSEIVEIIDFGNNQVFEGANVLTVIITLRKKKNPSTKNVIGVVRLKDKTPPEIIQSMDKKSSSGLFDIIQIEQNNLSSEIWTFYKREVATILKKIEKASIPLSKIAKTGAGIQSGLNDVYVVDEKTIEKHQLETSVLRNYVKTRDIKPYRIINRNLKVIRLLSEQDLEEFPNLKKYLLQYQDLLKKRYEAKKGICKWYAFAVPRNLDIFDSKKEKIITPIYSTSNKFGYDSGIESESYLTLSDTAVIQIKDERYSTKVILAILNSKLMNFYYKRTRKLKREGYYEYLSKTLASLPIKYSENYKKQIESVVDKMLSLNKRLNEIGDKRTDERVKIDEEIKKTDSEIDELVYKLYGISEEEKRIIEESLR